MSYIDDNNDQVTGCGICYTCERLLHSSRAISIGAFARCHYYISIEYILMHFLDFFCITGSV